MHHFDSQNIKMMNLMFSECLWHALEWNHLVELQHLQGQKKIIEKIKTWHEKRLNQKLIIDLLARYVFTTYN